MDPVTVRIDPSGRLVVPRDLREALGVPEGGELQLTVRDGELRATTRLAALRRIRAELKALAPGDASLVEDLLAGRRAEAARGLNETQVPALAPPPRRGGRG
jgi:AbrB family looped-hinge helix DNA binding protein